MQGLSSFEATKQIKQARPETRIVFLTMYDDQDYLFQAMNSGASGYLLKDSPAPELITAIREVARGGTHLNGRMLSYLVSDFRSRTTNSTERSPRFDALTARERHVLKVLAEGMSVKEIAADLNLSVKTVEAHKFNLMRKLDIHNKAHLVTYAVQKKLITIPALG
jgi:two-component system, NarL family, response regulator NreC